MTETNERGAAAIEYGILTGAVSGVIVLVVYGLGLNAVKGLNTVLALWPT